jgi:hypothetical protein
MQEGREAKGRKEVKKGETAVYKMERDRWNDYFELHVSKTSEDMRSHIEKLFNEWKCEIPHDGWDETRGLVHPVISIDGPFAYLFLAEDALGVGVVAHECLHVATSHERCVMKYGMDYGDEIGEDEERLAYFLSSCTRGVYNTLYENGHIKEVPRA